MTLVCEFCRLIGGGHTKACITNLRKLCEKCHRPRDNNHETLCAICEHEEKHDK